MMKTIPALLAIAFVLAGTTAAMSQHLTGLLFTCETQRSCKMEGSCSTQVKEVFKFAGAEGNTVYLQHAGRLDVATYYTSIDAYVWKRNSQEYRLKLDRSVFHTGNGHFHRLHIQYQQGVARRMALNESSGTCRMGW